ncbi:MAG TPA: flagellar basal body rod protein FlgC [Phycisphaerae bacterium]|nr:flagellar basal body rod protein FlgC [Phycisphaerae bacterium]
MRPVVANNPIDIAISGLRAQAMRINVVSANIANASTTRTETGEPYRRQDVVLSALPGGLEGVEILDIVRDTATEFQRIYQPGHPDAGPEGYVRMPNVSLPMEMMSLMTASRAYEANAAVMKRYGDMVDVTLELLQ